MIDMEPVNTPPAAPKLRKWPYVLVAGALFVAGLGGGLWAGGNRSPEETSAATTTTTTTTVEEITPGLESDEPVAEVAEALLPSMVQIEREFGLGSGVIYDPNGLILTAAHVVEGFDEVTVRLADGDRVTGQVLGADVERDIAVVRVDRTDLPAAPLALDDEPRVGQLAIALGSPFGLENTVTAGVVSAVNRGADGLIQTDAPINQGNSGGALADRLGRVIGINVSIFSETGANEGVGFAVPITTAFDIAGRLVAGETIQTAFLGIEGTDVFLGDAGAIITEVLPDSAAAAAGLQVDDRVVAVDGDPVRSMEEFARLIRSHQPGDQITLEVVRGEETLQLSATLGTRQS
jgi:S1-C subfamily serine protease